MTSPAAREPGKIITFYSYKGGTGRSMALANVAWILASNGHRVLVVDWDLEAPGLHRYFAPFMIDPDLTESEGVIDIVNDYVAAALTKADEPPPDEGLEGLESAAPEQNWYEPYANILRYAASLDHTFAEYEKRKGWIDFIPAGRQGAAYATRMNSFSWQNFYDRFGGGGFIERIKERMKEEYDYVLIDSRTGVSDTSGICTVQLPDILAVCFTLNRQSIEGASAVAASVKAQRGDGRALRIFPIPTRVEKAEKDKLDIAREVAKEAFAPLMTLSGADVDQYWGQVEVFYEPFYAYEEVLAVFGDKPLQTSSLLASMERITSRLTDQKVTQLAPVDESVRQSILAKYARQSRKGLGKGTQPGAREEYLFYVSYAHADLDEHLERFIDDLSARVRQYKGLPPSANVAFVDYIALGVESVAPAALDTLQRSHVLVPLLSPALFHNDRAAREFHHFRSRGTPSILPVLWVKPTTAMPLAVEQIQYVDAAFPDAYNSLGLSSLMRLRRYQDAYTEFVDVFAKRLVEAFEHSPLPEASAVEEELQNVFWERKPPEPPVAPPPEGATRLREIADTIPRLDRQAVIDVVDMIIPALRTGAVTPPAEDAIELLWSLRKCRLHDIMERVANELIIAGQEAPPFRLLYAEALIAQEKTTAALAVLNGIQTQSGTEERLLVNGLLGEAYKRLYVEADAPSLPRNQQNLARAIKAYSEAFASGQARYGINVVALLLRAARDDVRLSGLALPKDPPETIARALLTHVEERVSSGEARAWDYAVAAEACLALALWDDFSTWIASYIQEPDIDAFELSNLLWQFTQVWKLDQMTAVGPRVLPILQAEILRREGGAITLSAHDAHELPALESDKLERTFGSETFVRLQWLRTGLECSRAVGRIEDGKDHVYGTAFLVKGSDFGCSDPWLLLTCASVTGPPEGALPPSAATVSFESLGYKNIPLGPPWFLSPTSKLDVSLFHLPGFFTDVPPYRISPHIAGLERVYIIGHPHGGALSFSMHDNAVLDVELPKIHYRAPTETGSSGSPVFNENWELVAVHHAGSNRMRRLNGRPGTYEANEGIWVGAIQEAIAKVRPL